MGIIKTDKNQGLRYLHHPPPKLTGVGTTNFFAEISPISVALNTLTAFQSTLNNSFFKILGGILACDSSQFHCLLLAALTHDVIPPPAPVPEECLCCFDPERFYFSGMKMEGSRLCFSLGSTNTTVGEKA